MSIVVRLNTNKQFMLSRTINNYLYTDLYRFD